MNEKSTKQLAAVATLETKPIILKTSATVGPCIEFKIWCAILIGTLGGSPSAVLPFPKRAESCTGRLQPRLLRVTPPVDTVHPTRASSRTAGEGQWQQQRATRGFDRARGRGLRLPVRWAKRRATQGMMETNRGLRCLGEAE